MTEVEYSSDVLVISIVTPKQNVLLVKCFILGNDQLVQSSNEPIIV